MKKSMLFLLALLLVAVFAVAVLQPAPASATSDATLETDRYYYNHLNERQKGFYQYLKDYYDNIAAEPAKYQVHDFVSMLPANPTEQDYRSLWEDIIYAEMALKTDDPLYEMQGIVYSSGYAHVGNAPYFYIDILRPDLITADTQKQVDARIKQIAATAGTGDRYTVLRKLTHYLLSNAFYDPYLDYINGQAHYSHALANRGHYYNQSIYGLMLEGVSVCDGFSQSFKVLCNELNIPCIIIGNNSHAWNLVQMEDGKWYRVDLTNAAPIGKANAHTQGTLDSYFNEVFLNNDTVVPDGTYDNPYMLALDNVPLVTEFPEPAAGKYQYTGDTTNFSYTVAASTYTPGNGKFSYRINPDGKTCTITNYEGKESGDLNIPGKLDGYTVTAIEAFSFYYCSGFTGKLTIPDSVETIGKGAFAGCDSLTSVKLPANLHRIGQGAFIGCKALTEVNMPDLVDGLGDYAFYDCNKLATVSFGSHIRDIGMGAFDGIKSGAVIKGPANSAAAQCASASGITFQASGSLCSLPDANGAWEFSGNSHFHTCQHGGRFDYTEHIGMYCGYTCPDCNAQYCGYMESFTETVITRVNQKPATCTSLEYTGDLVCICGKTVETGDWVGDFADHAPENPAWEHDGYIHWQECACGFRMEIASHTGGTATATQQARCSVCGENYGELNPGYTGTVPPVVTIAPTAPTTPTTGTTPTTPTVPGGTTAPVIPGQTTAPTVPGQTTAPTVPGGTTAPTVPGQTNAPTTNSGSDPTEGTTPRPGATTGTAATNGSAETPTDPGSPVVTILLIVLAVAAVGVGGFFGFRFLRKKKENS